MENNDFNESNVWEDPNRHVEVLEEQNRETDYMEEGSGEVDRVDEEDGDQKKSGSILKSERIAVSEDNNKYYILYM